MQKMDNSNFPILQDGQLTFRIQRGEEETSHKLDLLELKLTCESCESKHHLQIQDGRVVATAQFLRDLAGELEALGVKNCTPTVAYQIWLAASAQLEVLKKNIVETLK